MTYAISSSIIGLVSATCLLITGAQAMAEETKSQFLLSIEVISGGIVNNPDIATDIAALIIANHYGEDQLEKQKPLVASDQSDQWLVEGSYNKNRSIEGPGPIKIWIRKRDARIMEMEAPSIMKIPSHLRGVLEGTGILEDLKRKQPPSDEE